MTKEQITSLEHSFSERKLLELFDLPRLSLFYLRPSARAAASSSTVFATGDHACASIPSHRELVHPGGQPVLDQDVKVVRVACLGGKNGGTRVPNTDEFELKRAACDLFDELARLSHGRVVKLEFKRGLPC